jgi:hypothetical protein
MNLLGLLLEGFLARQLALPRLERKARRMRGSFGLQVGAMAVTLSFSADGIAIAKGIAPKTRARVIGPLDEMVALIAGGGGLVDAAIAVLEGRVGIRGNPFALLGLLPILLTRPPAPAKALPAPSEEPS